MNKSKKSGDSIASHIASFAYNKDRSQVAVAPNNEKLLIFKTNGNPKDPSNWKLEHELKEHQLTISGVDWCAQTNQIVTCGFDRNAYVWSLKNGKWEPNLVILRVNRAATCVRWTMNGKKFAVGSGSKEVPVCRYEPSQNFWVARTIKKHKSTVLCLDWHPTGALLVTGCADMKCRVFSAFLKKVDDKAEIEDYLEAFGKGMTSFGNQLMEFDQSAGWIQSVAFSPSGWDLAFAGHDSSIHFANLKTLPDPNVASQYFQNLPFRALTYLSEKVIVAAGYDKTPYVFKLQGDNWVSSGALDKGEKQKDTKKKGGAFDGAFSKFQGMATMGKKFDEAKSASIKTRHQNTISEIRPWTGDSFATGGMDGAIYYWDINQKY